jgi:undecaprenyl-diphosphatase
LQAWNHELFLLINASAQPGEPALIAARFLASGLVVAAAALMVALWIWARRIDRAALLSVACGIAVALGINQVLGMLWYEPRPFMIGLGHSFMSHQVENSFPSDHGSVMWSMAFGLLATRASRSWGWVACLAALAVSWARIYLGLHFPVDMLASFLIGIVGATVARFASPLLARRVMPVAGRLYEGALDALHLSPVLFPRRAR